MVYRISYRKGLFLKKLLRVSLIIFAVLVLILAAVLVYLEPYVTYDREGAHLMLSSEEAVISPTEEAGDRPQVGDPQIVFVEKTTADRTIAEQGGYYITTAMLQDPAAVLEAVQALEEPCAVMIEVKSKSGTYYYSSQIAGAVITDKDVAAMDEVISYLKQNGFYLIAAVPAFRDTNFAFANTSCGLPLSSGALWMDEKGCYWLDPADETVLAYLMQIARELSSLGFQEVAYSDFLFPDSKNISYHSELSTDHIIANAAKELSAFFTGSNLMISYITQEQDFSTESCSGRIYITDADGSKVEKYVQAYGEDENIKELVFLANSRDSRFNDYAMLRPLIS